MIRIHLIYKKIILTFSILTLILNLAFSQGSQHTVVPYPQEVVFERGQFNPTGHQIGLSFSDISPTTRNLLSNQLNVELDLQYGVEIDTATQNHKFQILIGIPKEDPVFRKICDKNKMFPDSITGNEGYYLKVSKNMVIISANTEAGVFYGVQTLKQLVRGDKENNGIPCTKIKDWPALALRAVMDDISRGPVPNMNFMKEQIRRYSELKINQMSFYIEHVVKTKKHPDFAPSEGGITIDEFNELSTYAKDYHVELIGNFQSLGHFEKILSFPQYRHLGATERMLDPLNPESIEFLKDVYTEMAPAFSSEYFTPDCDEAWDLSRGNLAETADSLSASRIYANHINSIHNILSGLGKKTFIWGDIILEHPEILQMISGDIIIDAWTYGADDHFSDYIDPVKDAGFDFIISPGILNSRRIIPDDRMTLANLRKFINEGYKKGALGVYCTVWDDGGTHAFSRDWYYVAYNAEQCWRPDSSDIKEFDKRFSSGIYGDASNSLPEALHELNKLTDLGPTFEMNMNIFWKKLIPSRGEKVTFNPGEWNEVEEIARSARDIISRNNSTFYAKDLDFVKFSVDQYIFLAQSHQILSHVAENYAKALELQLTDREQTHKYLLLAKTELIKVKDNFDSLTTEFERLWRLENRIYWLDRALITYNDRQNAMDEACTLLNKAMDDFERGNCLPAPTDIRLDIRQQEGQYFQFWLLCGSFPIKEFENSSEDYLEEFGGEANIKPFPGMKLTAADGKVYEWTKYDSPLMGEINFTQVFDPAITAVGYAYCTIISPDDRTVEALLGSNDGATVYCNGEEVFHFHGKRSLIPDEDLIPLHLNEGTNHIVIKVEQWKGAWGFSFRLKEQEIRNHKQKYYILN